jgi:hypothetical protein
MRRLFAGLLLALGLATACGGRSREAEMGQSGAAGSSGADACTAGKDTYKRERDELVTTSNGCQKDADCGTLWETNACVSTCGTPVPAAIVDSLTELLRTSASRNCSSCPPIFDPPCTPPRPLKCIQGRCSESA